MSLVESHVLPDIALLLPSESRLSRASQFVVHPCIGKARAKYLVHLA